jgi:hypothetical protein
VKCSADGCSDEVVASVENRSVCRKHFLVDAYRQLESISAQIQEPRFHESHGEAAGRFLEDCMRHAADIACASVPPSNLERAQVLDVLLWASELHGRLRRSPRVRARMAVKLCSEAQRWEEAVETQLLSRHGFQLTCRHELNLEDAVICERLDNGWRAESRVVWIRRKESGETEAGFEFMKDENFWGIATSLPAPAERKR